MAEQTQGQGKKPKWLIPALIGGGLGLIVLITSKGGGGGGGATDGSQLDAVGMQINALKDQQAKDAAAAAKATADAQKQQGDRDAAQERAIAQQLNALSSAFSDALDDQNDALLRGLQQQAAADRQQDAATQSAFAGLQADLRRILDEVNRQVQRETPSPVPGPSAPISAAPAPVGGPNVEIDRPGGAGAVTRDQATSWWRSFGGGVSPWNPDAGPLSGPAGERIHSSDVWQFTTQNGRLPTSATEFLNWWRGGGGKGH